MPTNKPFFPNLRPVKKVITPKGEVLIRKVCKCGNEFMGSETQTRCENLCEEGKTEMKSEANQFGCSNSHRDGHIVKNCFAET